MQPSPVDVLITNSLTPDLVEMIQTISPRLRVTVNPAHKPEEIPDEHWARCEILYTDEVLPDPDKVPHLRWIQFHYAGIDKLLSAPILDKPDLLITTLSGAAVSQMAEYILTMMLALGHHLPSLEAAQKKSEWPKDRWERFSPRELRDSTVGIVGYGSIGRQAAQLLHTFGATVLATKRDAMHPSDNGYVPEGLGDPDGNFVHRLYPPQALLSMIRECDFVVITVPLTQETRELFTSQTFSSFKPSAYLIDVSRGGIIDHSALIKALQEKKLAGAALDVFPEEPLPSSSPLWEMPNVIISPHISGNSPQYDQRAMSLFATNLERYLANLPLYNLFDSKHGY